MNRGIWVVCVCLYAENGATPLVEHGTEKNKNKLARWKAFIDKLLGKCQKYIFGGQGFTEVGHNRYFSGQNLVSEQ